MQKSRAGLFLMELTISLLFFAFAAAVCIHERRAGDGRYNADVWE